MADADAAAAGTAPRVSGSRDATAAVTTATTTTAVATASGNENTTTIQRATILQHWRIHGIKDDDDTSDDDDDGDGSAKSDSSSDNDSVKIGKCDANASTAARDGKRSPPADASSAAVVALNSESAAPPLPTQHTSSRRSSRTTTMTLKAEAAAKAKPKRTTTTTTRITQPTKSKKQPAAVSESASSSSSNSSDSSDSGDDDGATRDHHHKHKHVSRRSSSTSSSAKTKKRKHDTQRASTSPVQTSRGRTTHRRERSSSSTECALPSKPKPLVLVLTNEPTRTASPAPSDSDSDSSRSSSHSRVSTTRVAADHKREVASKERQDPALLSVALPRATAIATVSLATGPRVRMHVTSDAHGAPAHAIEAARPSSRKRPLPGSSPRAPAAVRRGSTAAVREAAASAAGTNDKRVATSKQLTPEEQIARDHEIALTLAARRSDRPRRSSSVTAAAAAGGTRIATASDTKLKKRKRVESAARDVAPVAAAAVTTTLKAQLLKKPRRLSVDAAGDARAARSAVARKPRRPVQATDDAAAIKLSPAAAVKSPLRRFVLTPNALSGKKTLNRSVTDDDTDNAAARRAKRKQLQAKRESTGSTDSAAAAPRNGHASTSADTNEPLASTDAAAPQSAHATESIASSLSNAADAPSAAATGPTDESTVPSAVPAPTNDDDDVKEDGEEDEDGAVKEDDGDRTAITLDKAAVAPAPAAMPDLLSFVIPKKKIVRTDAPVAAMRAGSTSAALPGVAASALSTAQGGSAAMHRPPASSPSMAVRDTDANEPRGRAVRRRLKNAVPLVKLALTPDERDFVRLARRVNSFTEAALTRQRATLSITGKAGPYDVVDAAGAVLRDLLPRMKCPTKKQLKTQTTSYPPAFFGVNMTLPSSSASANASASTGADVDTDTDTVSESATPAVSDTSASTDSSARGVSDVLAVPIHSVVPLVFARREDREVYQRRLYGTVFVPQMLRVCTTLIARNIRYVRKTTGFVFNADRDRDDFARELGERYAMNASVPRGDIPLKHWQVMQKQQQPALVYLHYRNSEDADLAAQTFTDDYGAPLERKRTNKVGGTVAAVVPVGQQQVAPLASPPRRSRSPVAPAATDRSESANRELRPSDGGGSAWQPYHDEPRMGERPGSAQDWPSRFQDRGPSGDQLRGGRDRRLLDRYGGGGRGGGRGGPDPAYRYGAPQQPEGASGPMRGDHWRERDRSVRSRSRSRGASQSASSGAAVPPPPQTQTAAATAAPTTSGELVPAPTAAPTVASEPSLAPKPSPVPASAETPKAASAPAPAMAAAPAPATQESKLDVVPDDTDSAIAKRDSDRDSADAPPASAPDKGSASEQGPTTAQSIDAAMQAPVAAAERVDPSVAPADADAHKPRGRSASVGKENRELAPRDDVADRPQSLSRESDRSDAQRERSDTLEHGEVLLDTCAPPQQQAPAPPARGSDYDDTRRVVERQDREWSSNRRDFGDDRRRESGAYGHAPVRDFDSNRSSRSSGGSGRGAFGFDGRGQFERCRSRSFGRSDRGGPPPPHHGRDYRNGPPPSSHPHARDRGFDRRDDAHFHRSDDDRGDRSRYGSSNGYHQHPPPPHDPHQYHQHQQHGSLPHERRRSPICGPPVPPQYAHDRSEPREREFRHYESRSGGGRGRPPVRYSRP